jgi:hypothetical protein
VFAGVDLSKCEQLCRLAADVTLHPGEYAAHEGDGRTLFGVIEGKLEVTATVCLRRRAAQPREASRRRRWRRQYGGSFCAPVLAGCGPILAGVMAASILDAPPCEKAGILSGCLA